MKTLTVVDNSITSEFPDRSNHSFFSTLCGLIMTILIQLVLIAPMLHKEIPPTSGWYLAWSKQMGSRIMYSDFFVPFPPGSVFFEGYIPSLFQNSFLSQDVVHLVYWLFFSAALYLILINFAHWLIAFGAVSLALIAYVVQPGNIISGYYETMMMFVACAGACFIPAYRRDSKHLYLWCGIFLGISSTVKQTTWLLVLLSISLVLISVGRSRFRNQIKNRQFFIILGVVIPWMIITIWNIQSHNFTQMWGALLSGGGKNSGDFTFVAIFLHSFSNVNKNALLLLVLSLLVVSSLEPNSRNRTISAISGMVALIFFLNTTVDLVFGAGNISNGQILVVLSQLALILVFLMLRGNSLAVENQDSVARRRTSTIYDVMTGSTLVLSVVVAWFIPRFAIPQPVLGVDFYSWFKDVGSNLSSSLIVYGHLGLLGAIVFLMLKRAAKPDPLPGRLGNFDLIFIALAEGTLQIMNAFAGGPSIETWIFTIPIGLLIIFELLDGWLPRISRQIFFVVIGLWSIGLVQVQRETTYEWSGIIGTPIDAPRSGVKVQGLGRFSLGVYDSLKLELINQTLSDLEIGDTPVLYGLRNAGMSILFHTEVYELNCPVLWWDVCPEALAKKDEQAIKVQPPQVVFWLFETEETIASNEEAWRSGTASAAGGIQRFFEQGIREGTYSIALEFKESESISSPVTRILVKN